MNNKKNYKKGIRHKLVKAILLDGFITQRCLAIVDGSVIVYKRKMHEMIGEGTIKDTRFIAERTAQHVLTLANYLDIKGTLVKEIGAPECAIYEEFGLPLSRKVRFSKEDKRRVSIREILSVETQFLAAESGALTTLDGAPSLLNVNLAEPLSRYYTSKEYKRFVNYQAEPIEVLGDPKSPKQTFTDARIIGTMFGPGGNYIVYNFGNKFKKLTPGAEESIRHSMIASLEAKGVSNALSVSGVFFARDLKIFETIFSDTSANRMLAKPFESFGKNLQNVLVLPYTQDGRKHLSIMQQPDWIDKLKILSLKGLNLDTQRLPIPCDGYNGDKYVLLFAIPDVMKLRDFIAAANSKKDSECEYIICCFDYQEQFVRSVAKGSGCKIRVAPLDQILWITKKDS